MPKLKLTQFGDLVAAVFPEELLARLGIAVGDELDVVESPDGFSLYKHKSEFDEQVEIGREIMRERRAVLRELAK